MSTCTSVEIGREGEAMKAIVALVVFASLVGNSDLASAQRVCATQNSIGVYFDENASSTYRPILQIPDTFSVFIALDDLSYTGVWGLEVSYELVVFEGDPASISRLATVLPPGAVDLGESADIMAGYYIMGVQDWFPASSTIPFVEWRFVVTDPALRLGFKLGPVPEEYWSASSSPAVAYMDQVAPVEICSDDFCGANCREYPCEWCPGEVVSALLGDTTLVTAIESASFGRIKCLYR